jgi:hypothetical protein
MPEEHFSEQQINAIKNLFIEQINSIFIKIVFGNLIAILVGAGTVAVGWYRLGNLENQVAYVVKSINEGPKFTKEEGDALRAAMVQRDDDLQRQIDAIKSDQVYIRNRVDQIYNILR